MIKYADKKITSVVTWFTAIIGCLIGLGLPLAFFSLSYSYQDAALRTEADINAGILTQLINANPEMWRYEELRLLELLERRQGEIVPEVRRIVDEKGELIVSTTEHLPSPVWTRKGRLMDSGREVGTIEITRSLRPLLERTVILMFAGSFLGLAAFMTRALPLRMLRETLRALFEEKERAQVTLRSIGDGVITTDDRGNVTLINDAAEKMTGWTHEQARGRRLDEVFHIIHEKTRTLCENPVARVLREMKTVELTNHTVLIARDGTERIIADTGGPIRGVDGSIIGVVLVFRDVTDKQRLEAELQKAARLESIGILAGGIAHDFNNILTVILGNISLAKLDTRREDQVYDQLESAEEACRRAKDLTHQLLTFAKGGSPVKENISLADLIRSSSNFALTGSGIRSEIYIPEDLPAIKADPGQINQVMHNLMINAVEAMPGGGLVTVRAERFAQQQQQQQQQLPLPAGDYVRISVKDCGIGIAKEQIELIFDPYYTTKKRGSGLGLATCYSIVKKHGGLITAESEPGEGSLFQVYLPVSDEPAVFKRQETGTRIIPGRGNILVMDDEESIRSTIKNMLMLLGYDVTVAADGEKALELFQKARASAKGFDAVILDLTIPGGMGGLEVIGRMREMDSNVRAIVSSGYSENLVMSDFEGHGFSGVITKPYDVRQLSAILHSLLRKGDQYPGEKYTND